MNERLKEIRKCLKLSQDAFGERLGMTGGAVSHLENGNRNITDQVVKSICREFKVDYIWLTTGEGEMFLDNDEDFIIRIEQTLTGESSKRKNMFKALLDSSEADIEALDRILSLYAKYESEEQGKS